MVSLETWIAGGVLTLMGSAVAVEAKRRKKKPKFMRPIHVKRPKPKYQVAATLTQFMPLDYTPTEKLLEYVILCNNVGGGLGDPDKPEGERAYKYRRTRAKAAREALERGVVKTAENAGISLQKYRREVWHVLRVSLNEGVNITGRSYADLWRDEVPPVADPLPGELDAIAAHYVDFINARRVLMKHAAESAIKEGKNPYDAMRNTASECHRHSYFIIDDWLLPMISGEDQHYIYNARRLALDTDAEVDIVHNGDKDIWELWLEWPSTDFATLQGGLPPIRKKMYDTSLIKAWGFSAENQEIIISGEGYKGWVSVSRSRPIHETVKWPWEHEKAKPTISTGEREQVIQAQQMTMQPIQQAGQIWKTI